MMMKTIPVAFLILLAVAAFSFAGPEQTIKKHHSENGLSCSDCHTSDPPQPVATEQCLNCHERQEAKVDYSGEPDKHDSPHYGPELDCGNCHHEHRVSENFCAECHEFDFVVP